MYYRSISLVYSMMLNAQMNKREEEVQKDMKI
jgi:hypothetical protein